MTTNLDRSNTDMKPRVSVLMPAYNAGKYIDESIQSVLAQTFQDWELLIVNDGSTDDTVLRVESYDDPRIRLLNNPENLRLIKTLNRGLDHAQGELIARLDSDDNATPRRLELQVKALDDHPNWAMVGAHSNVINSEGGLLKPGKECHLPSSVNGVRFSCMLRNSFRHSAVTFRKQVVMDLGGYPSDMQDVEDYALWSMVIEKHDATNLLEVLCDYREHNESIMAKVSAKTLEVKHEPRRHAMKAIYARCAQNLGAPKVIADEWGEIWSQVRLPVPGERCDVNKARTVLASLLQYRPVDEASRADISRTSKWAYWQLLRVARLQGDKFACVGLAKDLVKDQGLFSVFGDLTQAYFKKMRRSNG